MSYINKKKLALTSIVFASILSSFCIVSFNSSSVSAVSASITASSSITLNATSSGTGVSINEESIGITTTCDKGYNLTIATSTSPNLYLNGDNTLASTYSPVNGTSTLGSNDNTNKWGYTLTSSPSSSTVFNPLSTTASSLRTVSNTTGITNETISIYYGAKTDSNVMPGSYSMGNNGTITYYLTMNPLCYTVDIAYDGNNADAGTMGAVNTGIIHTGVKDGDEINLIASNFSKSGYGFAGWSVDPNAGTKLIDNDNTNNPVVYGPQETVTLPNGFVDNDTDNDGIVKLYAVWIQSQGNLQGWTGCNNLDTATYDSTTGQLDLTKSSVTALTDQRDNDTYAVARLADGNCWMIENLRLDADATRGNNQYDPTVTNEWLSQGYGKNSGSSINYGDFVGLADSETFDKFNALSYSANSLYSNDGVNNTMNIGAFSGTNYRIPRYNNTNTSNRTPSPTSNDANLYSYGNYYSWNAAVADTFLYSTNNRSATSTSICPVGWSLPQGGDKTRIENSDDNDFWNLTVDALNNGANPANYNSEARPYYNGSGEVMPVKNKLKSYPNNFLSSGYATRSIPNYYGSIGFYWSSTAYSANYAYHMEISYSNRIYPGTYSNGKESGRSVRCIASEPVTYTLTYDANGGSGAPNSPAPIYANGFATFTVSNTIPTRSGYTFSGWIDEKGDEAQPGTVFATKNSNTILYAVWINNDCNPIATTIGTGNASTDAVCLQDVTPSMKANLPIADSTTGTYNLIDARDGQSYTVAKLADGNLWLTKNLNYGSSNDTLLTSHDTDLPTGSTFKAPASTTDFETTDNATTRTTPKILTDNTYGGYYSFAAAVASTLSYTASSQKNITTSICPKGWNLPTNIQYDNLRTVSGNTTYAKMSAAPYSFIRGGYRRGVNFVSQTSTTRLWTSTNYDTFNAYYTTAYETASRSNNEKYYGESVRCVASNGVATINYNANGGSGNIASQTGDVDVIIISSNSFTAPANSQFKNWNTRADGTGITVSENTPLSSIASNGDNITLYAQWDEIYYITFDANESSVGGTSGSATGTMTNQTVVRDVATSISTNNFALSGYIFYGWNTRADGTGIFYGDEQRITNLTSTGSTITLYAVWTDGALLDYGMNVNVKLKQLADNDMDLFYDSDNESISALVRSNTLPNDFTPSYENTISDSASPFPIYAWYDSADSTIYYYSEAANILLNKDSTFLFHRMIALSNLSTVSTWDATKVTAMENMFNYTGYSATSFVLDLSSWDTSSVANMRGMFASTGESATTFTLDLSSWDTSSVTDMSWMFSYTGYSATTWSIGDLSTWNTSNVTNMSNMFNVAGFSATTFVLDLSSWDTSSVTNMSYMFYSVGYSATTWSIGDLSSWDTSNMTNALSMFNSAGNSATTWSIGDLSSWDTSSATNMSNMFAGAGSSAATFTLNISSWDTSNVSNLQGMFSYAGYSASTVVLNLFSWDTSKATDMSYMFDSIGYDASSLSINGISSWNTSSVKNMQNMFNNAGYSATTWSIGDLSSWNTSNVIDMKEMFYNAGYSATTWSIGDLSSWNTSNVIDMKKMFSLAGYSAATWSIGDLSSWDTSSVTDMSQMFAEAGYHASTWSIGNLSSWNTSRVTTMYDMFYAAGYYASTWSIGDLSSWDTSNVIYMGGMFKVAGYSASTWSVGDLSSWNTPIAKDMQEMFSNAGYSATTWSIGDLSSWDTSSVTNMSNMFQSAGYSATTWSIGNLSSWDTSNVTNMTSMFAFAGYSATTFILNLSSWNTSSVTSMSNMFNYAGFSATNWSINGLSSWDTSNVTTMYNMFSRAGYNSSTFALDLSSWNTSRVTTMYNMFERAGYNSSVFTLDLSSWNTSNLTDTHLMFSGAGNSATTWSVTIPKTNDGTATGPISNTTSNLYGKTTSVTATPPSGRSFTLAN